MLLITIRHLYKTRSTI